MIALTQPWALALAPLPLLTWFLLPPLRARAAVRVPGSVGRLMQAMAGAGGGLGALLPLGLMLRWLGWLALVVALAGPYRPGAPLLQPTGRDVVVAVDLSASMAEPAGGAETGDEAQIDRALALLDGFIAGRRGDRVGLVAFASEAFLIAPLSFDVGAVGAMLSEVAIGLPGRRTDLGQAIGLTVKALGAEPPAERVLIAVSDGESNSGELAALDAARLAAEAGITVHMIGFATEIAAENVALMREIAELTGGRYFSATDARALEAVTAEIAGLLPVSADRDRRVVEDLRFAPLLAALLALCLLGWRELRGA